MKERLWHYSGTIMRVLDGDSVEAIIQVGFYMTTKQRLRLNRVNTPELHSADESERKAAQNAKTFVENVGSLYPSVFIRTEKTDAFGRFLAEIYYGPENTNLSDELIKRGFAKPYVRERK